MARTEIISADEYRRRMDLPPARGRGSSLFKPDPPAKQKKIGEFDSEWEADFALRLHLQVANGLIDGFMYHPFALRIGKGARYTPDFLVASRDGGAFPFLELHEVKGHWREAALVRLKVARDRYPWFRFVVNWKEHGEWKRRDVE